MARRHSSVRNCPSSNELQVDCGTPSPAKSVAIEFHCYAVQCDGVLDGFGREWHQPALVGKTQHEEITRDRIAKQTGGEIGRIEKFNIILAGRFGDALPHLSGRKCQIGVPGELASDRLVTIDDSAAMTKLQLRQGILARRYNEIATKQ